MSVMKSGEADMPSTNTSKGPHSRVTAALRKATTAVTRGAGSGKDPETAAPGKATSKPAVKAATSAPAGDKAAATKRATKAPAKKTAAKKATPAAKKVAPAAKKAAAAKTAAKKSVVKKPVVKKAAAKKSVTKKSVPASLKVREDESPWTAEELSEVRTELQAEVTHLTAELSDIEHDIAGLIKDSGDGAGDDQADVGTKTFEREHEYSLAQNSREMLEQANHALERIDDGTYGICENCGNPVGKLRLQAFPRATLCMPCKTKSERR